MRRPFDLRSAAVVSAALAALALGACSKGGVIGSGPLPTAPPATPNVSHEFTITTSGSQPLGVAPGSDGFVYIAESATSKIAKMTTGGVFTEYAVTANSTPFGMAQGGGMVWFTERTGNNVGSIDTSGTFSEFPLPTANAGPTYITVGSGGLMWFSETTANKIASTDSSGNITEYAVPTANAGLAGLVYATNIDNGLWIAEKNASAIIRFDTVSHTFSVPYLTPTANAGPLQIVVCPDSKALCFSESNIAKLGRILPNGTITEISLSPATSISGLANDAALNLYFLDPAQNKVGQIAGSTFAVSEFSIPTASSNPQFITLGPDLRMYFTETATGKVGQVSYF